MPATISTTTIYRDLFRELQKIVDGEKQNLKDSYDDDGGHEKRRKDETILQWSPELRHKVIQHLCDYVTTIMIYHVFVSSNKLFDLVLCHSHRNGKNTTTKHDSDNISHDYVDHDKKLEFQSSSTTKPISSSKF